MESSSSPERRTSLSPSSPADSSTSHVTSITVRAHWDGIQEHPAKVFVHYMIEAQPGTYLGLIKTDDPAADISDIHSTVYEWTEAEGSMFNGPAAGIGHGKEHHGDISITAEPGHCVQSMQGRSGCGRDSGFDDEASSLSQPPEKLHDDGHRVSPERDSVEVPGNTSRRRSLSSSTASSMSTWPMVPTSQSTLSVMPSPGYDAFKYYGPKPLFVSPFVSLSARKASRIWLSRFHSEKVFRLQGLSRDNAAGQSLGDISEDGSDASDLPTSFDFGTDAAEPTVPSTELFKGSLHVCFPQHIAPGIYEVQLDLEISLSQPDALGWRDFSLPCLLSEPCADVDGMLEFSLAAQPGVTADTTPQRIQPMTFRDQSGSDHWPHKPSLPTAQFDCTGCVLVEDEQDGWLKGTFLTDQGLTLRMRSRAMVHRLERWDCAVTIYSTTSYDPRQGMEIRHSVSLTIAPQEDIFAERVLFALLIRNGPQVSKKYRLEPGQCWMRIPNDAYNGKRDRGTFEIHIERDVGDMDKRLGLEFTCHYALEEALVHLPAISPYVGKVLAEKIWLLEPMSPLKLHAVRKHFLSTWQVSRRTLAERKLLCFDRIEVSKFYPVGFTDDAVVQIRGAFSTSRSCGSFGLRIEQDDDGWLQDAAEPDELEVSKLAAKVENIRFVGGLPLPPRKIRFDDEESSTSSGDDDAQSATSSDDDDRGSESESSSVSDSSGEQRPVDSNSPRDTSDEIPAIGENTGGAQRQNSYEDMQKDAKNDEDGPDPPDEHESSHSEESHSQDSDSSYSEEFHSEDTQSLSSGDSEDHALEEMVEDVARAIRRAVVRGRRHFRWAFAAFFWLLGRLLWRLLQRMQRRTMVRYLIVIVILACVGVPRTYFGGQPAVYQSVLLSNVIIRDPPGRIFVGDLEVLSAQQLQQQQPVLGAGIGEGAVLGEAEDVEAVEERELVRQGWRDRIDLALGWRPPVH
ncbi:MAG: hypothetical protein LQ348_005571 [Seirophora lacunosa]|nr:MAG: hypothetical protein LQ348_005571 [Seirophora lacunosa]